MAAGNTSKIAINNEIVLMRQSVRQSRVAVVRKLIKEAKLLQARKHGDDKVKEKCKRKAQRLVAEIAAVKKLKDDEISKFGITNTSKLQEVLNDTSSEPATRVMTRLAFHKSLSDRIVKFKEKFPEYEQHLGPGRKKLSKIQRQANREARNALKKSGAPTDANGISSDAAEQLDNGTAEEIVDEESGESSDEKDENDDVSEGENEPAKDSNTDVDVADNPDDTLAAKHGLEPGSILRIQTPSSTKKRKIVENSSEDQSENEAAEAAAESVEEPQKKRKNKETESALENPVEDTISTAESAEKPKAKPEKKKKEKKINAPKAPVEPKKPKPIRVVSKEATVKRFADLIEDKDPEERIEAADVSSSSTKRDMKIEKEVDSFFMTENGESEYLSVVVPKAKLTEDNEEDERFSQNHAAKRQKNFHERNNKFFSKIDQRANGGHGDRYGANAGGRHRQNDFGNGRGPPEKFGRNSNGPARPPRNGKPEFEAKKSEPKDEELHPSWAARKKQQEILKQGFQGKKIVFDD